MFLIFQEQDIVPDALQFCYSWSHCKIKKCMYL